MPHLLHLDSSADAERSRSRAITATFAAAWREHGAGYWVSYRDLHYSLPSSLKAWICDFSTVTRLVMVLTC